MSQFIPKPQITPRGISRRLDFIEPVGGSVIGVRHSLTYGNSRLRAREVRHLKVGQAVPDSQLSPSKKFADQIYYPIINTYFMIAKKRIIRSRQHRPHLKKSLQQATMNVFLPMFPNTAFQRFQKVIAFLINTQRYPLKTSKLKIGAITLHLKSSHQSRLNDQS
jgi:hypothetical protein